MKNNKGFSLVELILVLSVIAGLSITAFLLYEKVSNESIVKAESQNMSVVLAGTKSLYSGKKNYDGLSNSILVNADVFPKGMINSKGQVVNKWKGNIVVQSSENLLLYTTTNVPSVACSKLVLKAPSGFFKIMVGGVIVKDKGVPINITFLNEICSKSIGFSGTKKI